MRSMLSTSLLEGLICSDAARSSSSDIGNSDCENRAKRENEKMETRLFGNGVVVLGLATSHCRNDMKASRYVDERPHRYHR